QGAACAGGVGACTFSPVTSISAGGPNDTLHGPAADSRWDISGSGGGTVAGTTFNGFENLSGAPNNKDTFVLEPPGSLRGGAGGGAGGCGRRGVQGPRRSAR